MRIDWTHESFESGLETWTTEFRGMSVEIRRNPVPEEHRRLVDGAVRTTITAGTDKPLWERIEESPQLAMTNALKWINGYWDLLEDGPVQYEALPPEVIGE